jgi:N-acyl-D-amino-acid deacylase
MAGRMLEDVATEWGMTARQAAEELLPAGAIFFQMDEVDVRRIMVHELSMIGSDGLPHDSYPHPRLWGTFPGVGYYARELGLFSLEQAVRKMSGWTAEVFGLVDRGVICERAYAALVLFDPRTVRDAARVEAPTQPAAEEARVNGQPAFVRGAGATAVRAGRLVTREALTRRAKRADLSRDAGEVILVNASSSPVGS